MQTEDIYENLDSRRLNASQLADLILADPKVIGLVVDGLRQDSPVVRTTSAKALRNVSREKPRMLYPWFNSFATLQNSASFSVRIELIYVLANLAKVDTQDKLDDLLDAYFEPLEEKNLPIARALIQAALRIATAKPGLAKPIAGQLLRVENGRYENEESRRIVYQDVQKTLDQMNSMSLQGLFA